MLRRALELVCDGCPASTRLDAQTLAEEWPLLRTEGWRRTHGQHFCPECTAKIHGTRPDKPARRADPNLS